MGKLATSPSITLTSLSQSDVFILCDGFANYHFAEFHAGKLENGTASISEFQIGFVKRSVLSTWCFWRGKK